MQAKRKYSKPTLDIHEIDSTISLIMMSYADPLTEGDVTVPPLPFSESAMKVSNFEYAGFDGDSPFDVQSFR